ncbi:hypothetical protein OG735_05500 [Streptomyces sp. NBC_01210]|uniref:hypothetical protein n=1 Tax=Streptomyces sp. NBC_01210 TaxID=2903774 RepID=UPI002E14C8DE|nr:hypothetical protein OG735_05500 [Streptomyces sp. NBC_01210]
MSVVATLLMELGWAAELEDLFLRVGGRFSRVEPRRRMRDAVRGLPPSSSVA